MEYIIKSPSPREVEIYTLGEKIGQSFEVVPGQWYWSINPPAGVKNSLLVRGVESSSLLASDKICKFYSQYLERLSVIVAERLIALHVISEAAAS